MFQKVFINPRIFQKPILGLTALLGFLVGRWLQIEKNESGDNSLSVFGAQLPRGGGDWSAAILLASEEEQTKEMTVQIVGLPPYEVLCTSYIITDHNNAFNLWTTMGKPLNPSKIQAEALMEASLLRTEPVPMFKKQGKANISLAMPSPGVVLLRLCSNSTAPSSTILADRFARLGRRSFSLVENSDLLLMCDNLQSSVLQITFVGPLCTCGNRNPDSEDGHYFEVVSWVERLYS